MIRTARILAQGDEICTGATVDTNSAWLAAELWTLGVRVVGISAAPDDRGLLARQIALASADCDLVVSGGGLGPTTDDVTAEAVAEVLGCPLREAPEALAQIEERFRAISRPMTPSNRKQALLPEGASVLVNRTGTAPGFSVQLSQARAFFFPGVPGELKAMVADHLVPWLRASGASPSLRRRLHVCGVGESVLQDRLRDLVMPEGVSLGYKTWLPYNTIVVYGKAGAGEQGRRGFEQACDAVRGRLGADLFGEEEETLPVVVGAGLRERGLTIALAESCTAGLAAALLTEVPGSSAWVRGGVVAYANEVKQALLGVPAELLAAHGAVSEPCAAAMAEGVRRVIGADVGLSITGIAGPDGGSSDKPVGTVCFGMAVAGETHTRTLLFGARGMGVRGRERVRALASASALEWLRRKLPRATALA